MTKKYWVAVASLEHVKRGVHGGFIQVCHGRISFLKSMQIGDGIVYYSPTMTFGGKDKCQSFTAMGNIQGKEPYLFPMSEDFIPWRRDALFLPCKELNINSILEDLSFIKNKQKWGFPFIRGCFQVQRGDFEKIARAMKVQFAF